MTIQTLSFSTIQLSNANPRKSIDLASIEGLADSIRSDGLLQNLVVAPMKGDPPRYRLISGERRYRALKLLQERGDLPEDLAVSVEIKEGLTKKDTLRLATVENIQRENLSPLDEAEALAALLKGGADMDDLAVRLGLGKTTIKRRLVLNGLCEEAKAALESKAINLAQAEALTLGRHKEQCDILEKMSEDHRLDAETIRHYLLHRRPTVAMAIFPIEHYTGTLTTDLFGEDESTYFDDTEQFLELQHKAVEELAESYQESAAWIEITECYSAPRWRYDEAEDGEPFGVLINISPDGTVESIEGLAKSAMDEQTVEEIEENTVAPVKIKPAYSSPLCSYIAHQKSLVVQQTLIDQPRKAKEVAVAMMIDSTVGVSLNAHESLKEAAQTTEPPASYQALETQAREFGGKILLGEEDEERGWQRFFYGYKDSVTLYETIKTLSDADLDRLHILLTTLCFGQGQCGQLDTKDSLFNRVATDLEIDMCAHWFPDEAFLGRRTLAQLHEIAQQSGFDNEKPYYRRCKKVELVKALTQYFAQARQVETPDENQIKARNWLPDAMRFPAVEIDASEKTDNS